jgi:protein-disulfide isomerase
MMLVSSIWTVRGLYLFYTTGSCNGLNQDAFCVFDPQGANNQVSGINSTCTVKPKTVSGLTLSGINLSTFPVKNQDSKDKIVFIGCYNCDYTRNAFPLIEQLVSKFNVNFTFADYPTKEKTDYLTKVDYCVYREDPDKFWKLNDSLFASGKSNLANTDYVNQLMSGLGLDVSKMDACIANPQTEAAVQSQFHEIEKTNFFGTPTIFINGTPLVGPKPYRVYAIMLRGLWYW